MPRVIHIAVLLVLSLGLLAQEQGRPPLDEQPPVPNPPAYPEDMDPGVRPVPPNMPPDTSAPPRELTSQEAELEIQAKLDSEPSLRNNELKVEVSEDEVVVSGSADSEAERDVAIRIAESYAGERLVINKVEIRGTA